MDDEEIYMFDTQGYVILRNVLTSTELATLNAAVDRHADEISWFEYLLSPISSFCDLRVSPPLSAPRQVRRNAW